MNTAEQLLGTVASAWPDIVGADLAKCSRPIGIYDGALIIATPSASIMQTLAFLGTRIAEDVAWRIPGAGITRLRIRQTSARGAKA